MIGCQSSREVKTQTRTIIEPFPGVLIDLDQAIVEVDGVCCLGQGYLEQVACSPGTREHESLFVVHVEPSTLHAALLLTGYQPGTPGSWSFEEGKYRFIPPRGDELALAVRISVTGEETVEVPVRDLIRDHKSHDSFPDIPWVFAGSFFAQSDAWGEPGEQYIADLTGSIIGLVTFGDEVVGLSEVIADAAAVHTPLWEVNEKRMPPVGTPVQLIIQRWEQTGKGESNTKESGS